MTTRANNAVRVNSGTKQVPQAPQIQAFFGTRSRTLVITLFQLKYPIIIWTVCFAMFLVKQGSCRDMKAFLAETKDKEINDFIGEKGKDKGKFRCNGAMFGLTCWKKKTK